MSFDYTKYILDEDIWIDRGMSNVTGGDRSIFAAWTPHGVKSQVYRPLADKVMAATPKLLPEIEKEILENPHIAFIHKINLLENLYNGLCKKDLAEERLPIWLEELEPLRQWELKNKLLKERL